MMCRNNCGFYSNTNTEGLCSMCFKDMEKKMQESENPSERSPVREAQIASLSITGAVNEKSPEPSSEMKQSTTYTTSSPLKIESPLSSESSTVTPKIVIDGEGGSPFANFGSSKSGTMNVSGDQNCLSPLAESTLNSSPESTDGKKVKRRCVECKKKVGLTGFTCRCGGLFCSLHRYSDKHECSFDYKSPGAEQIRKSNPAVVAEKIKKI